MVIVHLDDSETQKLDRRLSALTGGTGYIRITSISDLIDLLRNGAPEKFLLVSDVKLGLRNIVTEFFAWMDEPEFAEIRPGMDERMKGFILYSGDFPNDKKSDLDFRIRNRFSNKFLGGFNRDDFGLICEAVVQGLGPGNSASGGKSPVRPKKGPR